MIKHHALTGRANIYAVENPLNDVVPNFTVFGNEFTTIWQKVAGGMWALAILVAIGYLGHGILSIAQSKGSHPGQLREAKNEATKAGIALGGLLSLAVIVGVFISLFSV